MKILHVLSHSSQITGSWYYARALAQYCLRQGHEVILCADEQQVEFPCPFIAAPIGNRKLLNRFRNIKELVNIIRKNKIDIVHAHSRAGSWVAYFATRITGTRLVSSMHMLQHLHMSTYLNIYGDAQIAVSWYIREQLINVLRFDPAKISIIPNGVDFEEVEYSGHGSADNISIIGRTSGLKGDTVRNFVHSAFDAVLTEFPHMNINFAGGLIKDLGDDTAAYINELNKKHKNRIHDLGFVRPLGKVFHDSKIVFGAGRVAVETLYFRIPLIVLGEAGYFGPVTDENFDEAVATNFADLCERFTESISAERVIMDIKQALEMPGDFSKKIEEIFTLENVGGKVMEVYERTLKK